MLNIDRTQFPALLKMGNLDSNPITSDSITEYAVNELGFKEAIVDSFKLFEENQGERMIYTFKGSHGGCKILFDNLDIWNYDVRVDYVKLFKELISLSSNNPISITMLCDEPDRDNDIKIGFKVDHRNKTCISLVRFIGINKTNIFSVYNELVLETITLKDMIANNDFQYID